MKTWDLSNMTTSAITEAIKILSAYRDHGVPDDFYDSGVELNFNADSGMVFLTNEDYNVAVYNDETHTLESWYNTPYEYHEGTLADLLEEFDNGDINDIEDLEYIKDLCEFHNLSERVIDIENTIMTL